MVTGKALSALLHILRANGVTHYQTKEIRIELATGAPAAVTPRPAPAEASQIGQGEPEPDEDDDMGDPRFLLERLSKSFTERTPPVRKGAA